MCGIDLIAAPRFCGEQNSSIQRWKLSASKAVWEVLKQYLVLLGVKASFVHSVLRVPVPSGG